MVVTGFFVLCCCIDQGSPGMPWSYTAPGICGMGDGLYRSGVTTGDVPQLLYPSPLCNRQSHLRDAQNKSS